MAEPGVVKAHLHYALYSSIIVAAVVIHGDRPIESAASKLTILLMALMIFSESVIRMMRARRGASV